MIKFRSISTSIITGFGIFVVILITIMVTISSYSTKDQMYHQMTTQGIQLGMQIRADLEMDEIIAKTTVLESVCVW